MCLRFFSEKADAQNKKYLKIYTAPAFSFVNFGGKILSSEGRMEPEAISSPVCEGECGFQNSKDVDKNSQNLSRCGIYPNGLKSANFPAPASSLFHSSASALLPSDRACFAEQKIEALALAKVQISICLGIYCFCLKVGKFANAKGGRFVFDPAQVAIGNLGPGWVGCKDAPLAKAKVQLSNRSSIYIF